METSRWDGTTVSSAGATKKEENIPRIRDMALSAIHQGVLIADASQDDFPIIYANDAFERLTGYQRSEIVGKNCRLLAGPDTSGETRAAIRQALAEGSLFSGRILNYRKDGTAFWNELSISRVEDEALGKFFIGVQLDVTERIEFEERLKEAQRMEAVGKLSGGIAHDFNNILALILGNAEVIAEDAEKGSSILEAATDIIEAASGGSELVSRMLQYARGESGIREPVGINGAISDMVALLSRTLGEHIHLETDLSAAVGNAKVDRALFTTSLLNLALNARDAMASGGTIRITTRRRTNAIPSAGTAAVITIADTGAGMDEVTRSRAFEPFYTTKQIGRGNGLGLAMVYNFVKQSGGDISIESLLGHGTTITMLLPIDEPALRSVDLSAPALRILLVEDDAKVRKIISNHLTRAGYSVDEVRSTKEALALLENGLDPALILSDIRLGEGRTGVDLAIHLQRQSATVPIMLMTGFAEELEQNLEELCGVTVLRKPFKKAELLAEVDRHIVRPASQEKHPDRKRKTAQN